MAKVGQIDILRAAESAAPAGGLDNLVGGDFMSGLTKLAGEANKFMDSLKVLSEKSGLPLIGDGAAISRLTAKAPAKAPAEVRPPPMALLPAPAASAAPAAAPAPAPALNVQALLAEYLDKAGEALKKNGLDNLTLGQVLMLSQNKTLGEILEVVKNGTRPHA